MAKFKNTRTGRTVDRPSSPPDIDRYADKAGKEARQKKWDAVTAKMDGSARWQRVEGKAKSGQGDG